jgi:hypothetical protein
LSLEPSRRRLWAFALAGMVVAGCSILKHDGPPVAGPDQHHTLVRAHELFAARMYREAAAEYGHWLEEPDPGPEADEALFRQALAHLALARQAGGAGEDLRVARALLVRLSNEYPSSPYRPVVETILGWRDEIDRLSHQLEEIKRIDLGDPSSGESQHR